MINDLIDDTAAMIMTYIEGMTGGITFAGRAQVVLEREALDRTMNTLLTLVEMNRDLLRYASMFDVEDRTVREPDETRTRSRDLLEAMVEMRGDG